MAINDATNDFGIPIEPRVDWIQLWPALEPSFKYHMERFVPTIESVVCAAIKAVHSICMDDDDFADKVMTGVQEFNAMPMPTGKVPLCFFVDADPTRKSPVPEVIWESTPKRRGVVIRVPSIAGLKLAETHSGSLRPAVVSMFGASDAEKNAPVILTPSVPVLTTPAEIAAAPVAAVPSKLPSLRDLPAPSALLASSLPHIVRISHTASTISIESTHEPTLTLISQYLETWTRVNQNSSEKVCDVAIC